MKNNRIVAILWSIVLMLMMGLLPKAWAVKIKSSPTGTP